MLVYVKNRIGKPLMPTTCANARKLLKSGRAKVLSCVPFIIKLNYGSSGYKQEVIAGMDTGSKMIGSAVIACSKVIYQAEIQLRSDVSKKMERRSMYRRNRRGRKTRYRKARWQNRANSKKNGRLAPSIRSKIESHIREKKFIDSIMPVSKWKIELASFDIHKISNPTIKLNEYKNGNQKDFYNVKAYVLNRDKYQCQKCKSKNVKLHVHHIIFRSNGGTNSPDNLITLCEKCHDKLHLGKFEIKGIKSKTKHATEMGIIKSQLEKIIVNFEASYGYETKFKREQILGLPKTHYYDAVSICCVEGELVNSDNVVFFKKHVAAGDYQQTKGIRSEMKIPTGKLFGFRKFDKIQTTKGAGFVKGKRSSGYFSIENIHGIVIHPSVNVKKDCRRLSARKTTLIERGFALSSKT